MVGAPVGVPHLKLFGSYCWEEPMDSMSPGACCREQAEEEKPQAQ